MIISKKDKIIKEKSNAHKYKNKIFLEELLVSNEEYYKEEEENLIVKVKCSMFCEYAMRIPDRNTKQLVNFSLADRPYWYDVYDCGHSKQLLKTGRQMNKSTCLGNKMLFFCCNLPNFHCMFVSPSQIQTRTFVMDRIKTPIEASPILNSFTNQQLMDNSSVKQFINDSKITLRYAFLNADRCRGVAGVNLLVIDEIQDILQENVGVIEETTFTAGRYKYFLYSGTPKTLDNPIEDYWQRLSTQNEWAIPCYDISHTWRTATGEVIRCHWNIINSDKHIEVKGLSCDKCHKLINSKDPRCHWVSLNPEIRKDPKIVYYEGFHIPQVISPDARWNEILGAYNSQPRATFYNEKLGLSYDSGEKPLTRADLISNCAAQLKMDEDFLYNKIWPKIGQGQLPLFAGIDWSGGSEISKTVLTISGYITDSNGNEFFTPFFWRRFEGPESDPVIQLSIIKDLLKKWCVRIIGCDYGGGFFPNSSLKDVFGITRVFTYQYANPKKKFSWQSELGRYVLHRSECMSDLFNGIKSKKYFRFPNWDQFETPFGKDFLNISAELNNKNMLIYNKVSSNTDDSFHALLYSFLASYQIFPEKCIRIINPGLTVRQYGEY